MQNSELINNRYQLGELIGRGGMGSVYRGIDQQNSQRVAIKLLKSEIVGEKPEVLTRFRREAHALAQLNHPNIVKMLDLVEYDDQHLIVMEYVGGGSLADFLRQNPQPPIGRTVAIALELADALTRAHHLNIIHRDLKPANILLVLFQHSEISL